MEWYGPVSLNGHSFSPSSIPPHLGQVLTGPLTRVHDLERLDVVAETMAQWADKGEKLRGQETFSQSPSTMKLTSLYFLYMHVDVDSWWLDFKTFLVEEKNVSDWRGTFMSQDGIFHTFLSEFLFNSSGVKHQMSLKFEGDLTCGTPTPSVEANHVFSGLLELTSVKPFLSYRHLSSIIILQEPFIRKTVTRPWMP